MARIVGGILVLVLGMAVVAAEGEVRDKQPATPEQRYEALLKEYNDAFQEYAKAYREAKTPEERLTLAFRLVLSRRPTQAEGRLLCANFDHQLNRFRENSHAAAKLLEIGDFSRHGGANVTELAAYTAVANLILNLDETITKE